jgi:hypothetical protein
MLKMRVGQIVRSTFAKYTIASKFFAKTNAVLNLYRKKKKTSHVYTGHVRLSSIANSGAAGESTTANF